MDYDDLKKLQREREKRNLKAFEDAFNDEMKRKGDGRTLDDVVGIKHDPITEAKAFGLDEACIQQMGEAIHDIMQIVEGEDFRDVCLRAIGLYRSVVRHASKGGKVKFVSPDGEEKTLKVRLK